MNELLNKTLNFLEQQTHYLAEQVPPPKQISFKDSFVFRYEEQLELQAIVQKLARMVASLNSIKVLVSHGLFQDQAAIQRMSDEFQEDIVFLCYGLITGEKTSLHTDFLNYFYQEEFDNLDSLIDSTQNRGMVSRKKIRAYISRIEGNNLDPSTGVKLSKTLNKTYSGFVHGASPQIMDMYGGIIPHFYISGMLGTPRECEHKRDMLNYFYRGILSFGFAAKAFGDKKLFDNIIKFRNYFEKVSGVNYEKT